MTIDSLSTCNTYQKILPALFSDFVTEVHTSMLLNMTQIRLHMDCTQDGYQYIALHCIVSYNTIVPKYASVLVVT